MSFNQAIVIKDYQCIAQPVAGGGLGFLAAQLSVTDLSNTSAITEGHQNL